MAMQDDQSRRLIAAQQRNTAMAAPKPQPAPRPNRAPNSASTQRASVALPGGFGPGVRSRAPGAAAGGGRMAPGGLGPGAKAQPVVQFQTPIVAGASAAESALGRRQARGATPMTQPLMPPVGGPQQAAAYAPQAGYEAVSAVGPMARMVSPPRAPSVGGVPLADSRLPGGRLVDLGGFGPGARAPSVGGVPLADSRLPGGDAVRPPGGARAAMTTRQGDPITVRGSEQSRQLGEQMAGGFAPTQKFNYQVPREVRRGGFQPEQRPELTPMQRYERGQAMREGLVEGVGDAARSTAENLRAAVTPPPGVAGFLGLSPPGEAAPVRAPRLGIGAAQAAGSQAGMSYDPETRTGVWRDAKTGEPTPFSVPERPNVGAAVEPPGQRAGAVAAPGESARGDAPSNARTAQGPLPELIPISQNLSPRERQGMQNGSPAGGVVPESVREKSVAEYMDPQLPNRTYDEAAQRGEIAWMDYGTAKRSGAVNAQPYNSRFDYDPTTGMYIAKRKDSDRAPINARTVQGPKVGRWLEDGQYGETNVRTENGVQVVRGQTPAPQSEIAPLDRFNAELELANYQRELQQGERDAQTAWFESANTVLGDAEERMMNGMPPEQRLAVSKLLNDERFAAQFGDGGAAANAALAYAVSAPTMDEYDVGSPQENLTAYNQALNEWLAAIYAQFGLENPLALN